MRSLQSRRVELAAAAQGSIVDPSPGAARASVYGPGPGHENVSLGVRRLTAWVGSGGIGISVLSLALSSGVLRSGTSDALVFQVLTQSNFSVLSTYATGFVAAKRAVEANR
jgi:hypothetical protein